MNASAFDWQGHRGARGLLPENTVPGFLKALEYPLITTLELDLAVSADGQLVVSHEPWMSDLICSEPDGKPVDSLRAPFLNIHRLTLGQIQAFDCGSRGNKRFPEQQALAAVKPTLAEVVKAADAFAIEKQRPLPRYNIEIKSQPAWDSLYTPVPAEFARLLSIEMAKLGIVSRSTVQSFDPRSLQALHAINPAYVIALLIEEDLPWEQHLDSLGFIPNLLSPYHEFCTQDKVDAMHQRGIKIIPWTVNDVPTMKKLINMGVDGIITDFPNLAFEVER